MTSRKEVARALRRIDTLESEVFEAQVAACSSLRAIGRVEAIVFSCVIGAGISAICGVFLFLFLTASIVLPLAFVLFVIFSVSVYRRSVPYIENVSEPHAHVKRLESELEEARRSYEALVTRIKAQSEGMLTAYDGRRSDSGGVTITWGVDASDATDEG